MGRAFVAPAVVGRGGGARWVVGLVGDDHRHQWQRQPDSIGLFFCTDRRCLSCAVCPGCLGSLDVALRARDGVVGMALYWCPAHVGGGDDVGQS